MTKKWFSVCLCGWGGSCLFCLIWRLTRVCALVGRKREMLSAFLAVKCQLSSSLGGDQSRAKSCVVKVAASETEIIIERGSQAKVLNCRINLALITVSNRTKLQTFQLTFDPTLVTPNRLAYPFVEHTVPSATCSRGLHHLLATTQFIFFQFEMQFNRTSYCK